MPVLRALARPMLASIFVLQGYDTFRRPERVAALAEPVVRPVADRVPGVPAKAEQAVRLNGAVQMVAGSLLALGRWPRLSALAIATTLVPTTLAGHRFWEAEDEGTQAQQRIQFLKNLSMFGGLLIAAVDTEGKPSIAWQARHVVKLARREARVARREARVARREARVARREAFLVARTAKVSGKAGAKVGAKVGTAGAKAGVRAGKAGAKAGVRAGKAGATTGVRAGKAGAKAGRLASRVAG